MVLKPNLSLKYRTNVSSSTIANQVTKLFRLRANRSSYFGYLQWGYQSIEFDWFKPPARVHGNQFGINVITYGEFQQTVGNLPGQATVKAFYLQSFFTGIFPSSSSVDVHC